MKLFVICSGIMGILLIFSIGIDMVMGYSLHEAIHNAFNPFSVMDSIEIFTLLFFVLIFFLDSFVSFLRKRRNKMGEQPKN